jgi:hypothetical protein
MHRAIFAARLGFSGLLVGDLLEKAKLFEYQQLEFKYFSGLRELLGMNHKLKLYLIAP